MSRATAPSIEELLLRFSFYQKFSRVFAIGCVLLYSCRWSFKCLGSQKLFEWTAWTISATHKSIRRSTLCIVMKIKENHYSSQFCYTRNQSFKTHATWRNAFRVRSLWSFRSMRSIRDCVRFERTFIIHKTRRIHLLSSFIHAPSSIFTGSLFHAWLRFILCCRCVSLFCSRYLHSGSI